MEIKYNQYKNLVTPSGDVWIALGYDFMKWVDETAKAEIARNKAEGLDSKFDK